MSDTQAELAAGRERLKHHQQAAELAAEASKRDAERQSGKRAGIDEDPVMLKPYLASANVGSAGTADVGKVIMDETAEEAEAREAAILAEENARMVARQGGNPDPLFDPDAEANRIKKQNEEDARRNAEKEAKDAADAETRSRILATLGTDGKAVDQATLDKAADAKKDEAIDKTAGTGGNAMLDKLLAGEDDAETEKKSKKK